MEDKLQRGLKQLAEAGHDKAKLGMSLILIHGALEEYFRSHLAREIAADEMAQGRRRTDWQDLLNLWQQHRSLSRSDRELIFAKNGKRNAVAHGDSFEISRNEMEQYARFVQDFMGVRSTSRPVSKPPVTAVPRPKPAPPPSRPVQTTLPSRGPVKAKWSCRRRLVVGFAALMILPCLFLLFSLELLDRAFPPFQTGAEPAQEETRAIPSIFEADETPVEGAETAVTATPFASNKIPAGSTRIQTLGTSNVRARPDLDSPVVGYTYHEQEFDVVETNDDGTWYKIRLADGTEGWIGSSRIKVLQR